MGRMCASLDICFDVVPDATSAWNPEHAPHATVTNRSGKRSIGDPFVAEATLRPANASMFSEGQTTNTATRPIASIAYSR